MRSGIVVAALKVLAVVRSVAMFCLPLRLRAVKAVVRDGEGRVLLVRHTYGSRRWMFPGGLVGRSEPVETAVAREMHEELGIESDEWVVLAEYRVRHGLTRQHLTLLSGISVVGSVVTNSEIADVGFFALESPPEHTSPATLRRLAEIGSGASMGGEW